MSELEGQQRIDAEYYRPHLLQAKALLGKLEWPVVPLGELTANGYRVVYENTFVVEEPFDPSLHVKFLQAANVSGDFPVINQESVGWVGREDWLRYPKGRIRRGEILVEVKGKAEKGSLKLANLF